MGGVCAPMSAGQKKRASEVMNNRIDENCLALEDSRGNWSVEKGPKSSSLFCSAGLRFLGEGNLERLPEPASCRRGIARPPVGDSIRMHLHRSGMSLFAHNRMRPERRARCHIYPDSEGKVAGSRAAAASISFEAAALGQS